MNNEQLADTLVANGWSKHEVVMDNEHACYDYYNRQLDIIKQWCNTHGMQHKVTYRILYRQQFDPTKGLTTYKFIWLFERSQDLVMWMLRWL